MAILLQVRSQRSAPRTPWRSVSGELGADQDPAAEPAAQPQLGGDARPMVRPADLTRYAGPPGPETERVPEAAPGLRPLRRQLGRERDRQRTSENDGQTGHGSKSLLRRGVPS